MSRPTISLDRIRIRYASWLIKIVYLSDALKVACSNNAIWIANDITARPNA